MNHRVCSKNNVRLTKEEKGAAIVEYILIVALVAICSIGVLTFFGDQIRAIFAASTKQLAGQDEQVDSSAADSVDGEVQKNISNF